jgi:hypothetical protein
MQFGNPPPILLGPAWSSLRPEQPGGLNAADRGWHCAIGMKRCRSGEGSPHRSSLLTEVGAGLHVLVFPAGLFEPRDPPKALFPISIAAQKSESIHQPFRRLLATAFLADA